MATVVISSAAVAAKIDAGVSGYAIEALVLKRDGDWLVAATAHCYWDGDGAAVGVDAFALNTASVNCYVDC